jgi:aminoglycoside phosphotransferase (APT) family kinase protein
MTDSAKELQRSLADVLTAHIGRDVTVTLPVRLSGGASKESWAFDLVDERGSQRLILRRDPRGATGLSLASGERPVLDAARRGGVPVPRVLWSGAVEAWGGATYIIMERVSGETLARRILRDPEFARARARLLDDAARALAQLHAVDPASITPPPVHLSVEDLVAQVQAMLDDAPNPHPVFEFALRWLRANKPPESAPALVHADFRMGNLIVGPEGLRSVIDWELSHVGDPIRDLGYFCIRSWRFGVDDRPAGGLGSREDLVSAYEKAGGRHVDPKALHYWEVYGTTVWGVQCGFLAQQFLRDGVPSVELAAIGRRAVEMEYDVLDLLGHGGPSLTLTPDETAQPFAARSTQDRPTATELLAVTTSFLRREVLNELDGRLGFHVRVAANVLDIVERELTLSPGNETADTVGLARILGQQGSLPEMVTTLAQRIRRGDFDGGADVGEFLAASTLRKLSISNPGYLRAEPVSISNVGPSQVHEGER